MKKINILLILMSTVFVNLSQANGSEMRCGWIESTPPFDLSFTDESGTWSLMNVPGEENLPGVDKGTTCACITVDVDVNKLVVSKVYDGKLMQNSHCNVESTNSENNGGFSKNNKSDNRIDILGIGLGDPMVFGDHLIKSIDNNFKIVPLQNDTNGSSTGWLAQVSSARSPEEYTPDSVKRELLIRYGANGSIVGISRFERLAQKDRFTVDNFVSALIKKYGNPVGGVREEINSRPIVMINTMRWGFNRDGSRQESPKDLSVCESSFPNSNLSLRAKPLVTAPYELAIGNSIFYNFSLTPPLYMPQCGATIYVQFDKDENNIVTAYRMAAYDIASVFDEFKKIKEENIAAEKNRIEEIKMQAEDVMPNL
ncbi:hypothetical protein [Castellaniella sp.]|uniref:hypothetical protein n=1 Tax=Castellaniella sp. TaxID=1955812 RepID=UPI002AFDE80B|nr:hypothetical protein [Castellaniella sp.]